MCSRKLVPLFQVLSAMFVAVAAEFAAGEIMGYGNSVDWLKFLFLFSERLIFINPLVKLFHRFCSNCRNCCLQLN